MDRNIYPVKLFFEEHREEFLTRWMKKVMDIGLKEFSSEEKNYIPEGYELDRLFQGYMDFMLGHENSSVLELLKKKIREGFLLSSLERINALFMDTARELFREAYPDAFDKRSESLNSLSGIILDGEVAIARYYEKYLQDLNKQLMESADILKRHNTSLVEFVDIATHQLQTPLWSILGFVSKLQRKHYSHLDEEGRHCLNRITANVSEMHQLIVDVTGMMIFDQNTMIQKDLFLFELIHEGVKRVRSEVDEDFICNYSREKEIILKGDPHYLKELFFILFKNAASYTEKDTPGKVTLSLEVKHDLIIRIEDEGIGIEERFFELVFKPMERLKEKDVSGTGMGLTFARRIVVSHGGEIKLIKPVGGRGTCVFIKFPGKLIRIPDIQ